MTFGIPSMQFIRNEEQRRLAGKLNFANKLLMQSSKREDEEKCTTKESKESCQDC